MFLKKPKASTDPRIRSLLQKAVRRGADRVVSNAIGRIVDLGDQAWLRSRTAVITFEEAWPLAQDLELTKDQESKTSALLRVTRSTKQKDAAGLGALSFAFHEGEQSMLDLVPSTRALRILSEALDRPNAYFDWAISQCSSEDCRQIVTAARKYLPAATWGWDKATILAAAFLATSHHIPPVKSAHPSTSMFPYWVALDKHTPQGKEALRRIADANKVGYRQLIWAGFYCESSVVNVLEPSDWFEAEKSWRLRKAGLNWEEAMELWNYLRPAIFEELSSSAESLRLEVEPLFVRKGTMMDQWCPSGDPPECKETSPQN